MIIIVVIVVIEVVRRLIIYFVRYAWLIVYRDPFGSDNIIVVVDKVRLFLWLICVWSIFITYSKLIG